MTLIKTRVTSSSGARKSYLVSSKIVQNLFTTLYILLRYIFYSLHCTPLSAFKLYASLLLAQFSRIKHSGTGRKSGLQDSLTRVEKEIFKHEKESSIQNRLS